MIKPMQPNRRQFIKQMAAVALSTPFLGQRPVRARSALETINLACVGVGGKGWSDMLETSAGQNVVAICDVDQNHLARAATEFPKAHKYSDWRELLEQKDIDAVTVSTPDHTHAPVSMVAMELGKHVYTQKPLTHTVYEARQLAAAASRSGVVTQMGIQLHSSAHMKNAVQIIRDGVIGKVSEVHTWTDRPGDHWQQGLKRPAKTDPVPPHLDWDQWLGTTPTRPFVADVYHPFRWRGWWDFGTGALGDMGCHILDPVVSALELGPPRSIRAEGPEPDSDSAPLWCTVDYEFPGTQHTTDKLKLVWYDAGNQPPRELLKAPKEFPGSKNGSLFVGSKGNLFLGHSEPLALLPLGDFSDYKMPNHEEDNHYTQWTAAILGNGKTSCPFSYSGPLTETVLLGNVAYRTGKVIRWDADKLVASGSPEAAPFLRRPYRKGWEVKGL